MPTDPNQRPRLERPAGAAALALVPTATFLSAVVISDVWVESRSVSSLGLLSATLFYLLVVSLPSLLPISAARTSGSRLAVTVAMGAVSTGAGILVVRTDDAQAGLAVLLVPYAAVPLGLVLWIGRAVIERRSPGVGVRFEPAQLSHRVAALVIDVAILAAVLFAPVTGLSDANREVLAGVLAVGISTLYMAGLTAWRGATLGQLALRLEVVDAERLVPIAPSRSVLRSLIVVLEVAAAPTLMLAPVAVAELIVAGTSGRSITDRLVRTSVVTAR